MGKTAGLAPCGGHGCRQGLPPSGRRAQPRALRQGGGLAPRLAPLVQVA